MFGNQFLSWLRAKHHFHMEMSRPRKRPLIVLFKSCVHLLMNIGMQKEALEKRCLLLRNCISKYDNAVQQSLKQLKPCSLHPRKGMFK